MLQKAAYEFDYGLQYAWILTVFTVTICFSVVCPFITPFGLIYLLLKHFVDRYNIYFAYIYTKVDKNIHRNAVSFTIASVIMLQFSILFFIVVKNRKSFWIISSYGLMQTSKNFQFAHSTYFLRYFLNMLSYIVLFFEMSTLKFKVFTSFREYIKELLRHFSSKFQGNKADLTKVDFNL